MSFLTLSIGFGPPLDRLFPTLSVVFVLGMLPYCPTLLLAVIESGLDTASLFRPQLADVYGTLVSEALTNESMIQAKKASSPLTESNVVSISRTMAYFRKMGYSLPAGSLRKVYPVHSLFQEIPAALPGLRD